MTSYVGRQYNSTTRSTMASRTRVSGVRSKADNKTKTLVFATAVALVAVLFTVVSCNCYINKLQQENNELRTEISSLEADIDSIKGQIVEETKVTRIEKIASEKYGMVYPNSENCITISDDKESGTKLAYAIREQAYY